MFVTTARNLHCLTVENAPVIFPRPCCCDRVQLSDVYTMDNVSKCFSSFSIVNKSMWISMDERRKKSVNENELVQMRLSPDSKKTQRRMIVLNSFHGASIAGEPTCSPSPAGRGELSTSIWQTGFQVKRPQFLLYIEHVFCFISCLSDVLLLPSQCPIKQRIETTHNSTECGRLDLSFQTNLCCYQSKDLERLKTFYFSATQVACFFQTSFDEIEIDLLVAW